MGGESWAGLRSHGIARDRIEIPRDLRDGISRDEKSTSPHGTGLRYHGIIRDGILRDEKSTILQRTGRNDEFGTCTDGTQQAQGSLSYDIMLHDCTFSTIRRGHNRIPWHYRTVFAHGGARVSCCMDGVSHRGGAFVSFFITLNYVSLNIRFTETKTFFQ